MDGLEQIGFYNYFNNLFVMNQMQLMITAKDILEIQKARKENTLLVDTCVLVNWAWQQKCIMLISAISQENIN